MEDLQKLLPGFPRVTPQAPFLQVTPNVNFMHNVLPRQNLQPTGQLEYKVLPAACAPCCALCRTNSRVVVHLCSRLLSHSICQFLGLCKLQELHSCCCLRYDSS